MEPAVAPPPVQNSWRRDAEDKVFRVLSVARRARRKSVRSLRVRSAAVEALRKELVSSTTAEVNEYITAPHLLFRPLRLGATVVLPLLWPLAYMPLPSIVAYMTALVVWYLACVCYFAVEVAMRPPWYKRDLPLNNQPPYWKGIIHDPKKDLGLDFEDVKFTNSRSGYTLSGWFLPGVPEPTKPALASLPEADEASTLLSRNAVPSNAQARSSVSLITEASAAHAAVSELWSQAGIDASRVGVVFVHGAGRDRRAFLRHSEHFVRCGMSALLFDTSEHGNSETVDPLLQGYGTSFGARERYDVQAAVNYMKKVRQLQRIVVIGTSAGASSSIHAAADTPSLVDCVVAENPFTRADSLLIHHCDLALTNYLSPRQKPKVRTVVFWMASRILLFRMGQYTRSIGPIDVVGNLTCPLLTLHSSADDVVPYAHGLAVHNAAVAAKTHAPHMAQFVEFKDAAHCALYDYCPETWSKAVMKFVIESLKDRMS